MEDMNLSSKLAWKIGLFTPVDLGCVFEDKDLINTGISLDTEITILSANNLILPRKTILDDIGIILGEDFESFIGLCSSIDNEKPVLSLFDLGIKRKANSEFIILKLKNSSELKNKLTILNKGLKVKYGITTEEDYYPHIILAEVRTGTASKYTAKWNLRKILEDSVFDLEDISLKVNNLEDSSKEYFITHFKNVDRFFRLIRLEKENAELSME